MEKEKNTQPHVTKNYHFDHVGQYIDYIHTQYVTIDKDAGIQIGEVNKQQPAPAPQSQHIEEVKEETHPTPAPSVQYSTYLIHSKHPYVGDDDIQKHLQEAANNGAAALVTYLSTAEAKIAFDFRKEKPSKIIKTLNQELGTDIKAKTFLTELERKKLIL
jgi:hypothetical protein